MAEPTVPLSERVEYASKGWLAEVERFLKDRTHMFPRQPISFATRLDNPPPHLVDNANEPVGYTMRIARGKAAVDPWPDPKADNYQRGDYNTMLPLLWTVHDTDAEASARMNREHRLRGGALGDVLDNQHALPLGFGRV